MIELFVDKIRWPFPEYVHAVTLWPFIIYENWTKDDQALQAHEEYHWHDQMKWLVVPWFIAYICLLPFYGGGRNHPMEKPAYAVQDQVNEEKRKKGKSNERRINR